MGREDSPVLREAYIEPVLIAPRIGVLLRSGELRRLDVVEPVDELPVRDLRSLDTRRIDFAEGVHLCCRSAPYRIGSCRRVVTARRAQPDTSEEIKGEAAPHQLYHMAERNLLTPC